MDSIVVVVVVVVQGERERGEAGEKRRREGEKREKGEKGEGVKSENDFVHREAEIFKDNRHIHFHDGQLAGSL